MLVSVVGAATWKLYSVGTYERSTLPVSIFDEMASSQRYRRDLQPS